MNNHTANDFIVPPNPPENLPFVRSIISEMKHLEKLGYHIVRSESERPSTNPVQGKILLGALIRKGIQGRIEIQAESQLASPVKSIPDDRDRLNR